MRALHFQVGASATIILATLWTTSAQTTADRGADIIDVEITRLQDPKVWGRNGAYPTGRVGIGIITTSHNVGTVNVDWIDAGGFGEPLDNRHPFIVQNMYRLREGRLEQIGLAWLKHGFVSTNDGCPDPVAYYLGVGCSDTYGNFTNANRQDLGPRSEVNPQTGYWEPCGSHFDTGEVGYPPSVPGDCINSHDTNNAPHDTDDHRLRVYDQDLLDADALNKIFIEGFYIVAGDENIENNFAHRQVSMIPPDPAPDWTSEPISNFRQRPAIDDWGDNVVTASPATEGKARVAVRVVPLSPTEHRYEYNVYNMDLDRQLQSFSVPVGPGVTLTDFGFYAPVEDEEPQFSMSPWPPAVSSDLVTWTAPAPDMNVGEEFPNTIRYGTMYTFWFTADAPPADSVTALYQFKPGIEGPLTATLSAPCALEADLNNDRIIDTADLGLLLSAFGTTGPSGDINGDGAVDTADLGLLLGSFGLDCIAN